MKKKGKQKLLQFIPARDEYFGVFDPPFPASMALPDWYKRQHGDVPGPKYSENGDVNHTFKHCMPIFDAMTAGYVIPVPQDMHISEKEDGSINVLWPSDVMRQISEHSQQQISEYPFDSSQWEEIVLKFTNPWIIKTPPGYSTLFTHPIWRDDLPFRCFSGLVDTDTYCVQAVNFPFLLRRGYRGMIHGGTPMIQAIPIKRDSWAHEVHERSDREGAVKWQRSRTKFEHRYKRDYRQRKEYK